MYIPVLNKWIDGRPFMEIREHRKRDFEENMRSCEHFESRLPFRLSRKAVLEQWWAESCLVLPYKSQLLNF